MRDEVIELCRSGDFARLMTLAKGNPNFRVEDRTPLLLFAAMQSSPYVVNELIRVGADVDARDQWENTALHMACYKANPVIVETLLKAEADSEAVGWAQKKPIHFAARAALDAISVIDLLMDVGADPDSRDVTGSTPLFWCIGDRSDPLAGQAVARHLMRNGANVNARRKNGMTALNCAIRAKLERDWIPFLVDLGANLEVEDLAGHSPRSLIVQNQDLSCYLRRCYEAIPQLLRNIVDNVPGEKNVDFGKLDLIQSFHRSPRPENLTFDHEDPWHA